MKKKLFDPISWYMKGALGEKRFIDRFVRYWGEVDIGGIKALEGRCYYLSNGYRAYHLKDSTTACDFSSAPGDMPLNCHRERKLFEHLGAWEGVRDADKKGMDEGWLFMNPAKAIDLQDDRVVANMNVFANLIKDKNNRIELTMLIPKGANFVDGTVYEPTDALTIPGTSNKQIVEEEVFALDADGNIVQEELFITNPDGSKKSYEPKRYQDKKVIEKVPSYVEAKNYLRANFADIWANRMVMGERLDRVYKDQATENKLKAFDKDPFEELLARHSVFLLDNANVRITDIGNRVLSYEAPAPVNENGFVRPIYEFIGGGSAILTDNSNLRYSLPAYTIRMVIKLPNELPVSSGIGKQIGDDCKVDYMDSYRDTAGEGRSYELAAFNLDGRLSGFHTKRSLSTYYWTPDLTNQNVLSDVYSNWQMDIDPTWWIADSNGYMHLKTEVLTTNKYIKKRKKRIELIQLLVDSDYSKEKGNVFVQIAVILAAIAIAVVSGGTLTAAAGLAMMGAVAASIGIFSLVLSLAAFALDALGMYGDAAWINKFNKTIQPLVIVASLFVAVKGILVMLEKGLMTVATMSVEQLTNNLIDWVKDKFINISFGDVVKILNKGMDMYSSNQLKSMQESVNAKQAEYEKTMQTKESSKYNDLNKEIANMMMNPLAMLGSDYVYDTPYEPIYSEYHSGCSCRTTVLALMNDGARTYVENIV